MGFCLIFGRFSWIKYHINFFLLLLVSQFYFDYVAACFIVKKNFPFTIESQMKNYFSLMLSKYPQLYPKYFQFSSFLSRFWFTLIALNRQGFANSSLSLTVSRSYIFSENRFWTLLEKNWCINFMSAWK